MIETELRELRFGRKTANITPSEQRENWEIDEVDHTRKIMTLANAASIKHQSSYSTVIRCSTGTSWVESSIAMATNAYRFLQMLCGHWCKKVGAVAAVHFSTIPIKDKSKKASELTVGKMIINV